MKNATIVVSALAAGLLFAGVARGQVEKARIHIVGMT